MEGPGQERGIAERVERSVLRREVSVAFLASCGAPRIRGIPPRNHKSPTTVSQPEKSFQRLGTGRVATGANRACVSHLDAREAPPVHGVAEDIGRRPGPLEPGGRTRSTTS